MTGPRASPLFLATVNEADVHWRLLAASGRGLDLPPGRAEGWTDLALAGSVLAVDRMIGDVVDRSEEAAAVRAAFDTMFDPSVDLVVRPGGRVVVSHRTGGPVGRRYLRAAEEAGFEEADADTASGRKRVPGSERGAPPPRLHVGVGWTVRDLDAPPSDPPLSWGAEVSLQNVGLSLWRADLDLISLHWRAVARERIVPDFSVGAGLQSADPNPEPDQWSTGVFWTPTPRAVVSLQRVAPLTEESWRIQLEGRWLLGGTLTGPRAPSPLRPNRLTSTTTSASPPN